MAKESPEKLLIDFAHLTVFQGDRPVLHDVNLQSGQANTW